jgi:hypothetical protein
VRGVVEVVLRTAVQALYVPEERAVTSYSHTSRRTVTRHVAAAAAPRAGGSRANQFSVCGLEESGGWGVVCVCV